MHADELPVAPPADDLPLPAVPPGVDGGSPRLPPLRKGDRVPKTLARRREPQARLTTAEVHSVAMWWRELGTVKGVARATGLTTTGVRKYVNEGDPGRGIPPLRSILPEDLPALPVAWKVKGGTIPTADPEVGIVEEAEVQADAEVVVLVVPAAQGAAPPLGLPAPPDPPPAQPPPPGPSQSPLAARAAPATPPGATPGSPAPPAPPQGASAGRAPPPPALTVGALGDGTVDHTLAAANAEVVRVSRNTRALFNTKLRGLAKLHDRLRGDLGAKEAPRLTPSEKDLLMLMRETRVIAADVERLYLLERDILGVGAGAGVQGPPPGEDQPPALGAGDAATIEDLAAQLRHFLGDNPNALSPEPVSVAGTPVTVHRSAFDVRPGAPPSGGSPSGVGRGE